MLSRNLKTNYMFYLPRPEVNKTTRIFEFFRETKKEKKKAGK